MRFLVTGGAGFIGSHLVDSLSWQGHEVVVLDNLSTGNAKLLQGVAQLLIANVGDSKVLEQSLERIDGVFHLAARVSVQDCIDDWETSHQDNLVNAMRVYEAAAQKGIPVVYASSAAVYGECSDDICVETRREMPISPYGADKLACEHQARAFGVTKGLSSIGLRFFNVYGPRQDPTSPYAGVISKFLANLRNGQSHVVFGDGLQSRDFVYVADVVRSLTNAMDVALQRRISDVCNVCTGVTTSILDLITSLDAATGADSPASVLHQPSPAGDIFRSQGSLDKMQGLLGMVTNTELSTGLSELVNRGEGSLPWRCAS